MTTATIIKEIENGAALVIEYVNGNGYTATLFGKYMMNVNFAEAFNAVKMTEAPKKVTENKTVVSYSEILRNLF